MEPTDTTESTLPTPRSTLDAEPAATFPVRVAAIDICSNAIRFLGAEFLQPDRFNVIDQLRTPVRLGHDVFLSGRLADSAIDAAVEAMRVYKAHMGTLGIARYRAVATSAVRDSANGDVFVGRAREDAGIDIEVITGAEEARLVHGAVMSRIDLGKKRWVVADLGGGSVEVMLVDTKGVRWSVSHGMGSVRLLEELSVAGDEPGRFRRRLEEYASTLQLPFAGKTKVAGFIATGGNIESLARMAGTVDENGVGHLPLEQLRAVIETLASLPYRQRVEQLGLREDRADVILPASMVYERIAVVAGFDEILVPFVGVKDGVVLDLVDDYTRREPHRRRRDEVVYGGALAIGRRYRFDDAHGRHVAVLALSLFDQLRELHGMSDADRTILMAAAVLHDVGTFISYKKHHKHSLYIISQSELPGFTPNEILMVANVGRYHRKGGPANHHELYMALESGERERVAKLAALLRIADALDREHRQTVTAVRATTTPKSVRLEAEGEGDLILERWAVENKRGLFEQTFDHKLRID